MSIDPSVVEDSPSPAGTRAPRRARGQLRVEALLAAAADVFADKGFDGATMTGIAARSESSIGSLYQFFPTKDALAHELMRGMMEDLNAALGAIEEQAATLSTDALADALSHALVRFRQRHPAFAHLLDTPIAAPEFVVGVRKRMRAQLAAILRRSGATLPDGPDSAQQQIVMNWSRLNGQAFDCSYVPAEYLDHVGAIGAFQAEAEHGSDADLVAFARQTLPALQEHERMISAALTALDCGPQ